MNCTQFQQILADYISGELAPDQHADARRHTAECRNCSDKLAGLQSAAAVLDSGCLSDELAAQHADSLPLPAARSMSAPATARDAAIPAWARYAAVVMLAFTAGYMLRGSGASRSPTEPQIVGIATPARTDVIERYNSITRERPDVPTFSRSLLALAAPARTK